MVELERKFSVFSEIYKARKIETLYKSVHEIFTPSINPQTAIFH